MAGDAVTLADGELLLIAGMGLHFLVSILRMHNGGSADHGIKINDELGAVDELVFSQGIGTIALTVDLVHLIAPDENADHDGRRQQQRNGAPHEDGCHHHERIHQLLPGMIDGAGIDVDEGAQQGHEWYQSNL
ncbi:MAG: hypothetical protein R3A44_44210 [Caldilineaceae bacterium]